MNNLGNRMKKYESCFKRQLLPNSYTIIRIDGKNFHSYCKKLKRPYDTDLIEDMDETARYLLDIIQGSVFAYVQSDEISILLEDIYTTKEKTLWFDGEPDKLVSLSSSYATSYFNMLRLDREKPTDFKKFRFANFDSRIFQLPNIEEVKNYFYWRWLDNDRNSIQRFGQYYFSHKQLHKKSCEDIIHMLLTEKNIDYIQTPENVKWGRFVQKEYVFSLYLKNNLNVIESLL